MLNKTINGGIIIGIDGGICVNKIVIAGSAKFQKEVNDWLKIFKDKNYEILDYPRTIEKSKFTELYSHIPTNFLENITKTDVLFIMNEDKNGKQGYIGYET